VLLSDKGSDGMQTVPLGKTGVRVSVFCLGTMYFGTRTDWETSWQILDHYVEQGGFFLDTANIYARWVPGFRGGESETLLGAWMKERGNRQKIFLATKVGFEMPGVERGLRAVQIQAECEKSLRRLQTDYIDLYYAHVDDPHTPLEETLEAFHCLVQVGKVRFIGASNFRAWRLEECRWVSMTHKWSEYCCIQQRYTYLRPKPGASFDPQIAANEDLLEYCTARGLTLLAYSPLLGGAYVRPDRPIPPQYHGPDTEARLRALRELASKKGITVNQLVLAWMIHSTPPVIPLVAGSTLAQMEENYKALEVKLCGEEVEWLNGVSG